jgi:flagellar biosynthesis/type III secretory pathway chaperone
MKLDEWVDQLQTVLNQQVGYHRQLLECVRKEHEALTSANISGIQEITYSKEAFIHAIGQAETKRTEIMSSIVAMVNRGVPLVLSELIIKVQGFSLKKADQLRNTLQTLQILTARIREQNTFNGQFLQKSLEHIQVMKRNVLKEQSINPGVYSAKGTASKPIRERGILSEEA